MSADLDSAKVELTEAYTSAISEAIEELDGKLSDEITKINEDLTKRIDDIETRLSAIEETLKNLTRDFKIEFDDYDIGILAGGTTSVGYTITGATEKTTVKALGQNGWSAKVTPDGTDKGKITVTAPNPMTDDEIIVLVYDGEYRTIMSSINFVTGVVTPSQTAVELEAEAGTIDITVTSNLNYKVSIPEEAKYWLSVVETKATKTETITFSYTECVGGIRKAIVSFEDEANNTISSMTFVQQGSAVEVTLTEAGTLLSAIGEDVYKSLKSLIINGPINGTDVITIRRMNCLESLDMSDAIIVSGGASYYDGLYTINDIFPAHIFDNSNYSLSENPKLKQIILPQSIVEVGNHAFYCSNIEKVTIGSNTYKLGRDSFALCLYLSEFNFPSSLRIIDEGAFYHCSSLKEITLNNGLRTIGQQAFSYSPITTITLPNTLESIGKLVFEYCDKVKEVRILSMLTNIGDNLFCNDVYHNATLYIPNGSKDYYSYTDLGRFVTIIEEKTL